MRLIAQPYQDVVSCKCSRDAQGVVDVLRMDWTANSFNHSLYHFLFHLYFSKAEGSSLSIRRLLLLGFQGSGKTSTLNTILSQEKNPPDDSQTDQQHWVDILTWRLLIVDTPGWKLETEDTTDETDSAENQQSIIDRCSPGPHALLLVVPIGVHSLNTTGKVSGPELGHWEWGYGGTQWFCSPVRTSCHRTWVWRNLLWMAGQRCRGWWRGVAVGTMPWITPAQTKVLRLQSFCRKWRRWCRRIKAGSLKWCGQALYLGMKRLTMKEKRIEVQKWRRTAAMFRSPPRGEFLSISFSFFLWFGGSIAECPLKPSTHCTILTTL